jgi:large subunit ribosomal protein L10
MNREEKAATIEEIAAQIKGSEAIFAVDYLGISVPQAAELRSKLREADTSFRIVKNRLTKIAADNAGEERLAQLLQGPTALAFVRGDTALAAKTISGFAKENGILTFKGGFMDGIDLDEDRFKSIARLPSRDVLNGQFAGIVASPLTGLVRGLGSMIQGLALQLGQIAEQGLVSGEAPADEKPAVEAPAEETPADESDGGPADVPVEEPPTESGAEAETPAEDDPSQAEGDDDETSDTESASEGASQSDSSPPSEEAPEGEQGDAYPPAADAERSTPAESEDETSDDDASKEEE